MESIKKLISKWWGNNELQTLIVTLALYFIGFIVFIALAAANVVGYKFVAGWSLGLLFALIGYGLLVFSCWMVQQSLNGYMFYLCFILRLLCYALAIVIFAYHQEVYSVFTIIGGISLIHLGIYASKIFPTKKVNVDGSSKYQLIKSMNSVQINGLQ